MNSDQLDIVINLKAHKQNGSENNNHLIKVYIDGTEKYSSCITENKFVDIISVNLNEVFSLGNHNISVFYHNTEDQGVLQIANMYVGSAKGGLYLDTILNQEGYVMYESGKRDLNKTAIWHHGTYHFSFESPFFYWLLDKFPIK